MIESVEKLIKESIGYTVQQAKMCRNCVHFRMRENPALDRDWLEECTIVEDAMGPLNVTQTSVCNKFKQHQ